MRLRVLMGFVLAVSLIGVVAPATVLAQTIGAGSCIGTNACTNATGNIGAGSCIGEDACRDTTGNIGDGSCNYGGDTFAACEGSTANIGNASCNVLGACRNAATTIGDGSCNGNGACNGITAPVAHGSCNTGSSCQSSSGAIGSSSCNAFASCISSAATVGNSSCNGSHSCIAHPAGTIADFTCNLEFECAQKADAQIRLAGGQRRGNDIYNDDGANQTATFGPRTLADGASRWFYAYACNDGVVKGAFNFEADSSGSDPGYVVSYYQPSGAVITAAVEDGTFRVSSVKPGECFGIRVRVTVTAGAAHGSHFESLITIQFNVTTHEDAVGLTLARL